MIAARDCGPLLLHRRAALFTWLRSLRATVALSLNDVAAGLCGASVTTISRAVAIRSTRNSAPADAIALRKTRFNDGGSNAACHSARASILFSLPSRPPGVTSSVCPWSHACGSWRSNTVYGAETATITIASPCELRLSVGIGGVK